MKFIDFELTNDNHFIAMEYYALMLNRTFLVLLTDTAIFGIKVNGLVSIESGGDLITKKLSKSLAIAGDLLNPRSYIKSKYLTRIQDCDLSDGSALKSNRANFIINRTDIKTAYYDPKKKWGMGYYPHDGKVYIETLEGKKREFIILGNQSGQKIANLILAK